MSPATYGNLLVGGLIGISTDNENGAAFELIPDPLEVTLDPDPRRSADTAVQEPAASGPPTDARTEP